MFTDHPLKIIVSIVLAALTLQPANAQDQHSIPLQSRITHVQPMTGIVFWSDNGKSATDRDAISLEYRYVGYNEVVQPDGEFDFTGLERILDNISGRNHQAILRFYFCYVGKQTTVPDFIRQRSDYDETVGTSEKKKTHFCDWRNQALQNFTLEFYTRLAERYDNDPRIAFLQTGFGLWAEYHIYDGPRKLGKTFPSKSFQAHFLQHMDKQFSSLPWSISIDSADYDYSPLEDNEELLGLSFGVFDDSFLCKPHARENAVNWKILGRDRWQRQPGGGELSYYNRRDQKNALAENGPNGVSFQQAARQFHITYMIGNDQPQYRSIDDIKAAGMMTGYRFRVTSATRNDDQLRLTVTNDGVAPIYRDAYFTAGTKLSPTSLRGLLPGSERECTISDIDEEDIKQLQIHCDAILPTQSIEFEADLR